LDQGAQCGEIFCVQGVNFDDASRACLSFWCLEQHRVNWARSFLSTDGRRMLCFYGAPDAESVRLAQREAELPVDTVWGFQRIGLDTIPSSP